MFNQHGIVLPRRKYIFDNNIFFKPLRRGQDGVSLFLELFDHADKLLLFRILFIIMYFSQVLQKEEPYDVINIHQELYRLIKEYFSLSGICGW